MSANHITVYLYIRADGSGVVDHFLHFRIVMDVENNQLILFLDKVPRFTHFIIHAIFCICRDLEETGITSISDGMFESNKQLLKM